MMRRLLFIVIFALSLAALLSGCGSNSSGTNESAAEPSPPANTEVPAESGNAPATPTPSHHTPEPGQTGADAISRQIEEMTIEEKVGQLVIVGLDGKSAGADARKMIQTYKVGGFILYKNNIESAKQTLALLNELKETNQSGNDVPLWLSVDQEGGRVSRLSAEFAGIPSAGQICNRNDPSYTRGIGHAVGYALSHLGFNMNFAPVLDINSNPKNPVIGDRAYGSNPDAVASHGLEMMRGLSSAGVAAVAKHFPGHGDTSVDSHYDLPLVDKTVAELEQFELRPFAQAIEEGVDAVMIAHLLMLKIDNKYPSSISKEVITDVLREKLAYDGVVITDDMTMGGLMDGNNIGDASVQSIMAGTDIILVGHNNQLQLEVLHKLRESVEQGVITEQRLNESVYRLLKLKQKYGLKDQPVEEIDVQEVNKVIESAVASD